MIFQKALLTISFASLSIIATATHAISFSSTFTGDDYVNSFSYNDSTTTIIDTTTLSGTQLWSASSTLNLSLNVANQYDFIWEVQNDGGPSGFLADFTLGTASYSTSTDPAIWSYSTDGINWASVTGYGQNNAPSFSTPWAGGLFSSGNGIATINPSAEWIWDDTNETYNETLFFKASITSPVPEPSTYALMLGGLGLIGFMAHRRKRNLPS